MDLDNKTAVVTGGLSGIGKAIVQKFASEGARVYVLDIQQLSKNEEGNFKNIAAGKIVIHRCDISVRREVETFISEIALKNKIDILVNNAGIPHIGNIEQTSDEDLERLINVNVYGVINCSRACISQMKQTGGGVILNMASVAATAGLADRFGYSMTKGAVLSMTYSMAKDYISSNIRCNSISPARVHTPLIDGFLSKNYPGKEQENFDKLAKSQPIGRMGNPEEVAELACYLCSDKASFITGSDYPIDGGFLKLNT